MQACRVAALIRGHLGSSWPCHALRLSVGLSEMQCRYLRGPSMAAPSPRSLDWVQSRPAEMEANGLSIGARYHKGEQPI